MANPIIIGAGLAGLSCARTLAEQGIASVLVSAQASERAQSVMAEGGINAALDVMGEGDSPEQHIADTLKSASGLASEEAISAMCEAAPAIVRDLIGIGVPFQVEQGHLVQRYFGGQKKARTTYAKSSTGKALVSAMIDCVRSYEAAGLVKRMPHHELVSFEIQNNMCSGVWIRDAYDGEIDLIEGSVVLCAGGLSGIFGSRTTGTTVNSGDVAALCLASGVELANLEMVQYHPTTVGIPGKRMLISEAARGEVGRLYTLRAGEPWFFMEELYPELGNLMPRDVVSREEAKILARDDCDGVWLDLRSLPRASWTTKLSDMRDECIHFLGLDPARKPIPVEPGIHYSMGGVRVDNKHRCNVWGLYAAGECACQYHGANRLGGNSLLGALFGGRVAGLSVAEDFVRLGGVEQSFSEDMNSLDSNSTQGVQALDFREFAATATEILPNDAELEFLLSNIAYESLGVIRNGEQLEDGLAKLDALDTRTTSPRFANRIQLVRAMILSAQTRTESRGAQYRSDFPETREEFACQTIARVQDDALVVRLGETL